MATERVTGAISQAEANKDNLQHLEGAVPVISRHLLYDNLPIEVEVAGYTFIKGLLTHPDSFIHRLADDALDARWDKVGFYWKRTSMRRLGLMDDVNRTTYREETHEKLYQPDRIALLALVRRQGEDDPSITSKEFADLMLPLVGPEDDPKEIAKRLTSNYVLTEQGQYVPLVEAERGRFRVGHSAYGVLKPHLPVLEAISWPGQVIETGDAETVKGVGKAIDRAVKIARDFFDKENVGGMRLYEDKQVMFPSVLSLGIDLEHENDPHWPVDNRQVVAFLDEDGRVYRATHWPGRSSEERVGIDVHQPAFGARRRLLLDFWGRQVAGPEIGSIDVRMNPRGLNTIQASGVLKPGVVEGLADADKVTLSEEALTFEWNDLSARNKEIHAQVNFSTAFKDDPHGMFRRAETHISAHPSGILVPETHTYRPPRIKRREGEEDFMPTLRGPRTEYKEIKFDKQADTVQVRNPKGAYTVSYEVTNGTINVTLKGRNWERTLAIPQTINPVTVAETMAGQINALIGTMQDNKEFIQKQVSEVKRLTLAENDALIDINPELEDSDLTDYAMKKYADTDQGKFGAMNALQEQMNQMDARSQWALRIYMMILGRWHYEVVHAPEGEAKMVDEDPRVQMRFLARKHNLEISNEALALAELIFLPGQTPLRGPSGPSGKVS